MQLKNIPDELEVVDEDLDEYDLLDTAGGGGGGGGSTVGSGAAVVKRADPNCEHLIQNICDRFIRVPTHHHYIIFSVVYKLNAANQFRALHHMIHIHIYRSHLSCSWKLIVYLAPLILI